jgi:hypothetical protein
MDPLTLFLIAMGGTVLDIFGNNSQRDMNQIAGRLNQAELDANMEFIAARAKDESLNEMIALRQNLSHMAAVQNARGANTGAGSALFVRQESEQVAKRDEDMRELNMKADILSAKGKSLQSNLQTTATDMKLKSDLTSRIFNTASSASRYNFSNNKSFSPVSDSSSSFSSPKSRGGFGMEPV